jgi:hypothetical protein
MYRVVLTVDGKELTQSARIEPDPTLPTNLIAADQATVQPPPRLAKYTGTED